MEGPTLDSYEVILSYLRSTRTKTGLTVNAHLVDDLYPKNVRISDRQMEELDLERHQTQPHRNYTVYPTYS